MVGSGGRTLTPPQAQQLALARLVLADPHTLVLDEATSLIDPRAARHLERSLAAVLDGRTVIAIAHRLFSAHDADRVAVVEDGRITELGSHDELVERGRLLRRALVLLARDELTRRRDGPGSGRVGDRLHRDGLDLHQLAGVAEHGHAEQRARGVVVAESSRTTPQAATRSARRLDAT